MISADEFMALRIGDRITVEGRVIETPDHSRDLIVAIFDLPIATLDGGKFIVPASDIVASRPKPIEVGEQVTWGDGGFSYEVVAIRKAQAGVAMAILWSDRLVLDMRCVADVRRATPEDIIGKGRP